jgi:hypothetical protein
MAVQVNVQILLRFKIYGRTQLFGHFQTLTKQPNPQLIQKQFQCMKARPCMYLSQFRKGWLLFLIQLFLTISTSSKAQRQRRASCVPLHGGRALDQALLVQAVVVRETYQWKDCVQNFFLLFALKSWKKQSSCCVFQFLSAPEKKQLKQKKIIMWKKPAKNRKVEFATTAAVQWCKNCLHFLI